MKFSPPGPLSFAEKILFGLFAAWMTIGFFTTTWQLTETAVRLQSWPAACTGFICLCLRYGDPLLMLLAALNTHWLASRSWGLRRARRWAMSILLLSGLIETCGTLTGFPFGAYRYTHNFGPLLLGVLPLTIPLSWFVLVTNGLFLWRSWKIEARPWMEAAGVATLVTGLDYVMEPFAVRIKAYWLWESAAIPWQNYLSWWVVSFLLVRGLAPAPRQREVRDLRPAVILGSFFLLFFVTRIVHRI